MSPQLISLPPQIVFYKNKKSIYSLRQTMPWQMGFFFFGPFLVALHQIMSAAKFSPVINIFPVVYVAAANTTSQTIWLRKIFNDMGKWQDNLIAIQCDSKSAIVRYCQQSSPSKKQNKAHYNQVSFQTRNNKRDKYSSSILQYRGAVSWYFYVSTIEIKVWDTTNKCLRWQRKCAKKNC